MDVFEYVDEYITGMDGLVDFLICLAVVLPIIAVAYRYYIRRKCILSNSNVVKAFAHGIGVWRVSFFSVVVIAYCYLIARWGDVVNARLTVYLLSWGGLFVIAGSVRKFLRSSLLDNEVKEKWNNRLQVFILLAVTALVLIGVVRLLEDFKEYGLILPTVLGWIFQDYIKGVISYCHLHYAGLLHFGDWIIVKKYDVSGMIIDCTLLTVTVRNWDNTISSIPMYSLQAESFQNNQEMVDGKTTGRRMKRSFIIDTSTVRVVSDKEKSKLESRLKELGEDTIALENAQSGSLNITLFRLYLRHWLMNNDEICRFPRLIVALKEPQPEGIPLEVYVFILKTRLAQFELVQSDIEEHILKMMQLFGLRLYQRISAYDAAGKTVHNALNVEEVDYE